MKVLVTGGSGWTAEPLMDRLHDAGHTGLVFDISAPRRPLPGSWAWVKGDVRDMDLLSESASGCHAAVHLAVAIGAASYDSAEMPFAVNVRGTYNVFEAARRQNVARIVLVSSAPVHLPKASSSRDQWISDAGPDHLYDLTKRLQEEIAQDYSRTFGARVLILRAGHVVDGRLHEDAKGRRLQDVEYCRGGWLCRHDLAEACLRALESPVTGTLALVGSRSGRERFVSSEAEEILGFRIKEDFANYEP